MSEPIHLSIDSELNEGASGDNFLSSDNTHPKHRFEGNTSPSRVNRAREALLHLDPQRQNNVVHEYEQRPNYRSLHSSGHGDRNETSGFNQNSNRSSNGHNEEMSDFLVGLQNQFDNWQRSNSLNASIQRRPKIMPDSYDGKKSWSQYLTHFETISSLNDWGMREKALYLGASLRGEACQVLQLIPQQLKDNYNELVKAMNRRFDPGHNASLCRVQLRTKAKQERESLPQLAQSIRTLATQAYPTADQILFDSLCCDHFIDALQDDDLKMRLLNSDSERFDDIVALAIKYETYVQARKLNRGRKYVREIQAIDYSQDFDLQLENNDNNLVNCNAIEKSKESSDLSRLPEQVSGLAKLLQEFIQKLSSQTFTNNQAVPKPITCYHCGKPGHKRPNCPEYKNTGRGSFGSNSKSSN